MHTHTHTHSHTHTHENRVHTGYEWNKYNQTHYDHDNPPPKIVQVGECVCVG